MHKILTDKEVPYITDDLLGEVELPDDMISFICSYLTNNISCAEGLREFVENYNKTVSEDS